MASVKQKKNWMKPAPTSASSASGKFSSHGRPWKYGASQIIAMPSGTMANAVCTSRAEAKKVKPVEPVAERLEQERVDAALADVLGDLEVVLVWRGGRVDQDHEDEVGHHALEGVARERLLAGEGGLPEEDRAEQRHEAHRHAEQEVPAVDELGLHPEVEDLGLEAERGGAHGRRQFSLGSLQKQEIQY